MGPKKSQSLHDVGEPKMRISASTLPLTCLVLQMALHFNLLFSPIYFLLLTRAYMVEKRNLNELENYVTSAAILIAGMTEVPRLLLGTFGNYSHNLSWILSFLLLTIFIQSPIQILMMKYSISNIASIYVLLPIMTAFLVVEILACPWVLKWLVHINSHRVVRHKS